MSKHLLFLAGTGEARELLASFAFKTRFRITASLSGVTNKPLPLGVETRVGGFGGVDGLANWCVTNHVDAIIDMTHPYAAQMSIHAAALSADLPVFAFSRPAWQTSKYHCWHEFDSWTDMASTLPVNSRPFLAGGSRALHAFAIRPDLMCLARGLNFDIKFKKMINIKILNKTPHKKIEDEIKLLLEHKITHVCAKNSGGEWSKAKIEAAQELKLAIWFLRRPSIVNGYRLYKLFQSLDQMKVTIEKLIV